MSTDAERMIAVLHVLEDMRVTVDELHARGCPPEVVEAVEILTGSREEESIRTSSGGSAPVGTSWLFGSSSQTSPITQTRSD
jgi:hypothetical protein